MKKGNFFILTIVFFSLISCKKYLDKKPDIHLAVPTSLADFQALLDRPEMTEPSATGIGDLGSDDYFLSYATYQSFSAIQRNCYTWASDIWEGGIAYDWNDLYLVVYYCNVVLKGLNEYHVNNSSEQTTYNAIYGGAQFIRAAANYSLEETFGQPYKPSSANSDLGIPLKLTDNLASLSIRSSVQNVYDQIISDLKAAIKLLPNSTPTRNRPTKAAAFAMLARVYLTMQDYPNAVAYADSSIQINGTLFDYNNLPSPSATNPFQGPPNDFSEVLYPSYQEGYGVFNLTSVKIDSVLFKSYNINDLRRTVYFRSVSAFKGNYSGSTLRLFNGPAVDEMYLIRAECNARLGNKDAALIDLNALMIKRWKSNNGTWTPFTATDADDALKKILVERRKELLIRGLRWIDLRRLNQDPICYNTYQGIKWSNIYIAP